MSILRELADSASDPPSLHSSPTPPTPDPIHVRLLQETRLIEPLPRPRSYRITPAGTRFLRLMDTVSVLNDRLRHATASGSPENIRRFITHVHR